MSAPTDGVFSRLCSAIESKPAGSATGLFIGREEWDELCLISTIFSHPWPPGATDGYDPEKQRAEFRGIPIYRVDAASCLFIL